MNYRRRFEVQSRHNAVVDFDHDGVGESVAGFGIGKTPTKVDGPPTSSDTTDFEGRN